MLWTTVKQIRCSFLHNCKHTWDLSIYFSDIQEVAIHLKTVALLIGGGSSPLKKAINQPGRERETK